MSAVGLEARESSPLICAHETGIADDIRAQDRSESAFNLLRHRPPHIQVEYAQMVGRAVPRVYVGRSRSGGFRRSTCDWLCPNGVSFGRKSHGGLTAEFNQQETSECA